jgi:hypothetical protein
MRIVFNNVINYLFKLIQFNRIFIKKNKIFKIYVFYSIIINYLYNIFKNLFNKINLHFYV